MGEIATADVLACLEPIWDEKRPTAVRVRRRIGAVMKWALRGGDQRASISVDRLWLGLCGHGGFVGGRPHGGVTRHAVSNHGALFSRGVVWRPSGFESGRQPGVRQFFILVRASGDAVAQPNRLRTADRFSLSCAPPRWRPGFGAGCSVRISAFRQQSRCKKGQPFKTELHKGMFCNILCNWRSPIDLPILHLRGHLPNR